MIQFIHFRNIEKALLKKIQPLGFKQHHRLLAKQALQKSPKRRAYTRVDCNKKGEALQFPYPLAQSCRSQTSASLFRSHVDLKML